MFAYRHRPGPELTPALPSRTVSPGTRGLDGVQRQKGGAARVLAPQQGDAGLGGGFVLHHDVLQRTAQCRLNGDLPARLDSQDRKHRPDDAPQRRAEAARITVLTEFW